MMTDAEKGLLNDKLDHLNDQIRKINEALSAHRDKFDATNATLKAHGDRIGDLHTTIYAIADEIPGRIGELEILLLGDRKKREIYETAKKGNVWPNIQEPPLGVIEVINKQLESLHGAFGALSKGLDARFEIVTKLSAFFGPMMAGKNPPLDGNLIASKSYVDDGIARFAHAIRDEVREAKDFVAGLTRSLTGVRGFSGSLVTELTQLWARERVRYEAELAAAGRPSRIQSLIYAVTGRNGHGERP